MDPNEVHRVINAPRPVAPWVDIALLNDLLQRETQVRKRP